MVFLALKRKLQKKFDQVCNLAYLLLFTYSDFKQLISDAITLKGCPYSCVISFHNNEETGKVY